MSKEAEPNIDQQLEAYLDGLMSRQERIDFETQLAAHPELMKQVEVQAQIDASLGRLFPHRELSTDDLSGIRTQTDLAEVASAPTPIKSSTTTRAALLGLAAVIAWILVVWQLQDRPDKAPFFQPRPVVQVYQEILDNGFQPYYECREEDRFADTFERRQGIPLVLNKLPEGSHMLGLSYAGGLSRDTTAILCHVDDQPVVVFVDRLESDLALATEDFSSDLSVHRIVKNRLVFYEVTPFETATIIGYLSQKNAAPRTK